MHLHVQQGERGQYSTVRWYEIQQQTVKGSELHSPRVRAGPSVKLAHISSMHDVLTGPSDRNVVPGTVYDASKPHVELLPYTPLDAPVEAPKTARWWRRERAEAATHAAKVDRHMLARTEDWENATV